MKTLSMISGALACALGLSFASLTATAQNAPTSPAERMAPATGGSAAQAKAKASKETANYVEKAATGDLFEVQSSELALKQAESPEVKAFAQLMTKDHTASTQALKAGIQSANLDVKVPDKLDKAHQAKIDTLRKAKGKDFDQAYMREQVTAHQDALKLHKTYAEKGDNPVLKNTAANTATIVEHHLAEAQKLAKGTPQTSSTPSTR